MSASQFAKQAQQAGKNVGENFNRFVEGNDNQQSSNSIPARSNMDENKRSFWDDFSALANDGTKRQQQQQQQSSAIGTSAMGMGKSRGGAAAKPQPKKQDDGWDDW